MKIWQKQQKCNRFYFQNRQQQKNIDYEEHTIQTKQLANMFLLVVEFMMIGRRCFYSVARCVHSFSFFLPFL